VQVGKEYSEKYYATSGVPQGSNIVPLLFLICINDLPGCITGFQCLLFADDFKILKEVSSQAAIIAVQEDMDFVISWLKNNRMNWCRDLGVTIGADCNFRMAL